MKKIIFIASIYFLILAAKVICSEDESFSIRRAYIDVIGVVPTAEEIDWYCVYNKNSYEMAVDWLLKHPNYSWNDISKQEARKILLSNEYKNFRKMPLSKDKLNKIILYLAGSSDEVADEAVKKASIKFIKDARTSSDNDLEAIDHITYRLMSRVTNIEEANYLSKFLKEKLKTKSEEEAWMDLFDQILHLQDVRNR